MASASTRTVSCPVSPSDIVGIALQPSLIEEKVPCSSCGEASERSKMTNLNVPAIRFKTDRLARKFLEYLQTDPEAKQQIMKSSRDHRLVLLVPRSDDLEAKRIMVWLRLIWGREQVQNLMKPTVLFE